MGSVYDKGVAVEFFIPRSRSQSGQQLMERVQATHIRSDPDLQGEFWDCRWATMYCHANRHAVEQYDVLALRIHQGEFLELLPGSELEPDHTLMIAQAFSQACTAVRPDVAFITGGAAQSHPDWIEKYYVPLVLRQDANALVETHFRLLYMSIEIASKWNDFEQYQDLRSWEEGPVFKWRAWREGLIAEPDGVYLFSGTGHRRLL